MDESRLVDREVRKCDALREVGIRERREVDGARAHLVAEIVDARLPADQIFDVLDHEMG